MAVEEREDVVFFAEEPKLADLSDQEFFARYDGFSLLLVRMRDDIVVAASRTPGEEELVRAYRAHDPSQDELTEFTVEPGPVAIDEIGPVCGDAVSREQVTGAGRR